MKTACFTGHRPRGLRGYVGHEAYEPLVGAIERACECEPDGLAPVRRIAGRLDDFARAPAMAAMPKGGRP